jgi:photosystem II stability/assembly factor-like uncharacterized protein
MKTYLILVIFCASFLCVNGQWTEINSKTTNDPTDIHFVDSLNGFISCSFGTLLNTNDGGENWNSSKPTSASLMSVFAVDKDTVYTARTAMYKSGDNCSSWLEYGDLGSWGATIFDIHFATPKTGFIIKSGSLYKSSDYGLNWSEVHDNVITSGYIFFTSNDTGYVYGGGENDVICFTAPCPSKPYGQLLKTVNGGDTWQNLNFYNDTLNIVGATFFDNNNGFLITSHNTLHYTKNGGGTWDIKKININSKITKGLFVNKSIGYVIALNNKIYSTVDGGYNWSEEHTSNKDLYYIATTGKAIIVAGDNGYILRKNIDFSQAITAVSELSESNIELYPNPSKGTINISVSNEKTLKSLRIYNSFGQLCYNTRELSVNTINVEHLPRGIYHIYVRFNDNKESVTRIMINNR